MHYLKSFSQLFESLSPEESRALRTELADSLIKKVSFPYFLDDEHVWKAMSYSPSYYIYSEEREMVGDRNLLPEWKYHELAEQYWKRTSDKQRMMDQFILRALNHDVYDSEIHKLFRKRGVHRPETYMRKFDQPLETAIIMKYLVDLTIPTDPFPWTTIYKRA